MNKKTQKAAVMIYPFFSLQEITCLTSCLTLWYEYKLDIFASSKDSVKSEDGFTVTANKTFDEFDADDYECLILPGIINPIPALLDEKNIKFLESLKEKNIIIAAISSSPLLLAKSGLLDENKFTSGLFNEILYHFDFIPKQNIVYKPIVYDENIITGIGFAFKEFAVEVIRALGIECADDIFAGVKREYKEGELDFKMGEENFKEFLTEYNNYRS